MFLRSVLALVRAQLIELRRSKTALFWMMAFPIGFLLLFGFVMARGDARVTAVLMPGSADDDADVGRVVRRGAAAGAAARDRVAATPARDAGHRGRRRHRARHHGAAHRASCRWSLLMTLARAIFGMQMAGSWPSLTGVFLSGAVALVPMGMLLGSAARDIRTAPAIANLIFFPMMFLSGSAIPFAVLPDGVKRFARLLPTTYLNDAYSSVIVRGEGLSTMLGSLAVLIAIGIVGTSSRPCSSAGRAPSRSPRKALATIAIVFGRTLAVAACAAPAFRISDMPGTRRIEPGAAQGQVRVLRGATVLDGLGGRIVNARVVIRDHRIADVTLDDERTPLPEGAVVETVNGRYLIPGLFDSHVHWGGTGGIGASPIERTDDRMAARFRRDAGRRRHLGRVAHRRSRRHADVVRRGRGGRASARRERSSPGRRSQRRVDIRQRCSASCRGWPSS